LTLTLTGLAADSFIAGGPGAAASALGLGGVYVRRCGDRGRTARVSVTPVIAIAAAIVGVVAIGFALGRPASQRVGAGHDSLTDQAAARPGGRGRLLGCEPR
jgi:hypothetical protein